MIGLIKSSISALQWLLIWSSVTCWPLLVQCTQNSELAKYNYESAIVKEPQMYISISCIVLIHEWINDLNLKFFHQIHYTETGTCICSIFLLMKKFSFKFFSIIYTKSGLKICTAYNRLELM